MPLGPRVLKFAADLLELEATGVPRARALDPLCARTGWYDPPVVERALRVWVDPAAVTAQVKPPQRYSFPAVVRDLRQGQILLSKVVTAEGRHSRRFA